MIRKTLNFRNTFFIADLYKGNKTATSESCKFVMLRKYDIINGAIDDTDLFFIEKDIYTDVLNELAENNGTSKTIAFPITDLNYLKFGSSITLWNNNIYTDMYQYNDNLYKNEFYLFYDKDKLNTALSNNMSDEEIDSYAEADIKCDIIKIYHPHNFQTLKSIVHVNSNIHGINFHFYCRPYESLPTYVDSEFTVNNNIYSEYIKIRIPNIEYMFDGNVYFKENLYHIENNNEVQDENIIGKGDFQYISFESFSLPYVLDYKEKTLTDKTIIIPSKLFISDYITKNYKKINKFYPITVTMYPTVVLTDDYNYEAIESMPPINETFQEAYEINLAAKLSFDPEKHIISVIGKFIYPENMGFNNVDEAYCYFNNITDKSVYSSFEYDEFDSDNYKIGELVQCVGYQIDIYSNPSMTNLVWSHTENTNPELIDGEYTPVIEDFAYNLNDLFSSWDQLPETLILNMMFIDKYTGVIYASNRVPILKETFKYFINHTNDTEVILNDTEDDTEETASTKKIFRLNMSEISGHKFVDKLNCVIHVKQNESQLGTVTSSSMPKVIYKPIFYKVQDLQNIYLRNNVLQNIGINLAQYMTKVETFKLNIAGTQIIESARNDAFVIFKIQPQTFTSTTGKYDIVNQDDEYISSGSWTIN